jgi:GNAT superfamily N-acetyltransferase
MVSKLENFAGLDRTPPEITTLSWLASVTDEHLSVETVLPDGKLAPLNHGSLIAWRDQTLLVGRSEDPQRNNIMVQAPPTEAQLASAMGLDLVFAVPRVQVLEGVRTQLDDAGYTSATRDTWLHYPTKKRLERDMNITVVGISKSRVADNHGDRQIDPDTAFKEYFLPTLDRAYADGENQATSHSALSPMQLEDIHDVWDNQGLRYSFNAYVALNEEGEPAAIAAVSALFSTVDKKIGRILHVGCMPEYRKKGLGSAVMKVCINDILRAGRTPIAHTVSGSYAEKFHETQLGFERLVTIDSFYPPET